MKQEWSGKWVSSRQPRKQRKYVYNAPLHVKRRLLSARLSKDLTARFKKRSVAVRTGDMVMIMRGEHKGHKGKVEEVNVRETKVYVEGLNVKKVDGSNVLRPIHPSNLRIIELKLEDKMRAKMLSRKPASKAGEK